MHSLEADTQAFVIRIWIEEAEDDGQHTWRGYITHVFSGQQSYLKHLEDIQTFIVPYLRAMGVRDSDLPGDASREDGQPSRTSGTTAARSPHCTVQGLETTAPLYYPRADARGGSPSKRRPRCIS